MARQRSIRPGVVHHVISRFVAREWFIRSEEERRQYGYLLGRAVSDSDWSCISYAIMSSHIHLAMVAGADSLASWLGAVNGPFAEWINRRKERVGPVFMRPKVLGVSSSGVARLMAYLHLNPVRAGVVDRAEVSEWTSHRAYLEPESAPPWLDVSRGLELSGFADGDALHAWIEASAVTREDLNRDLLDPPRAVGRPKTRNPPEQEAGFDFVARESFLGASAKKFEGCELDVPLD